MTSYLEREHYIPDFETDMNGLWRLDFIFRSMQEMASQHSEILNVGRGTLLKHNIVWMLARTHVKMEHYPRAGERVRLRTWPGIPGKITMSRFFEFYDDGGERFGYSATSWILDDVESRRILLPAKVPFALPGTDEYPEPLPEPKKFRLPAQPFLKETERTPMYCDVDTNGHMNNASYISWMLDLFPLSRYANQRIVELKINYAAEAKPEWPALLRLGQDGDTFFVHGIDPGDTHTIFEAIGSWAPIK